MIRHIVIWKLQATDDAAIATSVAAMAAALEPLAVSIPGIRSLRVHANTGAYDTNWDVVLIGDYDSFAALTAYQGHPDHVAAALIVRQHTTERASVDFEF